MEDYSELVGDSRIEKLCHDFKLKTIIFNLTRYRDELEEIEVRFEGVVNQDFQCIDSDNIIFGIEETDWDGLQIQFPDLMKYYKHYKSIDPEDRKRIGNGTVKCYHIRGSVGLEGYVIAEAIRIIEK
ncbi:hypothetical protein TH61_05335 [Rufibacter sp. DG15C]|uniref:hypothetical protein n=1 Tax=Rufibacter sp. DG15C TaxID=1379909 RepID=UPI00078D9366|nr:hypothetical protein [Rufibacter sp. DG15C]AMM50714.1 hypothetical protein TH61_05335 [Rufibacter sp. DG15C]